MGVCTRGGAKTDHSKAPAKKKKSGPRLKKKSAKSGGGVSGFCSVGKNKLQGRPGLKVKGRGRGRAGATCSQGRSKNY